MPTKDEGEAPETGTAQRRAPAPSKRGSIVRRAGHATAEWVQQPVRDRALRHTVSDHVLGALRSGHLPPGARVHEASLARALGVSLSPVREALFRLSDQGVLEHRPRRGFYVKELSEEETRQVYQFRALLEGFAARTVAERRQAGGVHADDAAALAAMAALIEEGARAGAAGDRETVASCNARYHDHLVRLAHNALLDRSWALLAPAEWLLHPTWTWRHEPIGGEELQDWVARHQRLLSLVDSGDPSAAESEASAHVRESGEGNLRRRFPKPHESSAANTRNVSQERAWGESSQKKDLSLEEGP